MKKILLSVLVGSMAFIAYGEEEVIKIDRSVEESITKDYDQDGVYSPYERALRKAQTSVYVTLPEKRGYWYTMLDRIKAEDQELLQDSQARMRKK